MSLQLVLPKEYGLVAAAAISTTFLTLWQSTVVSKARKLAQVPYPAPYASNEEAATKPLAKAFNCAQRAHGNTLENLPGVLIALAVAGLKAPVLSSAFAFVWIAGRVAYTKGYCTGDPKARSAGSFGMIGQLGLLVTALWQTTDMIREGFGI